MRRGLWIVSIVGILVIFAFVTNQISLPEVQLAPSFFERLKAFSFGADSREMEVIESSRNAKVFYNFEREDVDSFSSWIQDTSGKLHHGDLNSEFPAGNHFRTGIIGKAVYLDGDDFISIADAIDLEQSFTFGDLESIGNLHSPRKVTISMWIKPESFGSVWQTLFFKGNFPDCTEGAVDCDRREYGLFLKDDGLLYFAFVPQSRVGVGQLVCQTNLNNIIGLGVWQHIAVSVDADEEEVLIYLNGVVAQTCYFSELGSGLRETVADGSLNYFTIGNVGGSHELANSFFNGLIDEFKLYHTVLSENEVFREYNSLKPLLILDFEEIVGRTVLDSSDRENHGSIYGSAYLFPGEGGRGLRLDEINGVNSHAQIPDANSLDLSDSFTLSAWIKTSFSGEHQIILEKNDAGTVSNFKNYGMYVSSDGEFRAFAKCNNPQDTNSHVLVNDNSWHHVAFVRDAVNNERKVYVDGVLVNQEVDSGCDDFSSQEPLYVGTRFEPEGRFWFNGIIDSVRVYDDALNDADVLVLSKGTFVCSNSLDDDGDYAVDLMDARCESLYDATESGGSYQCEDGKDNDKDGSIDENDLGCKAFQLAPPGVWRFGYNLGESELVDVKPGDLSKHLTGGFPRSSGADPAIFKDGETFYLYYTSLPTTNFDIWSSNNLYEWNYVGEAFYRDNLDISGKVKWENVNELADYTYKHLWSPSVFKWNGLYVLLFSAIQVPNWETNHEVNYLIDTYGLTSWLAYSSSPAGPFGPNPDLPGDIIGKRLHEPVPFRNYRWGFSGSQPHSSLAITCPSGGCDKAIRIGDTFFVDDDGSIWLVYSWFGEQRFIDGNHISIVKLDPSDISLTHQSSPEDFILINSKEEIYDTSTGESLEHCDRGHCVAEAPIIIKRNGKYILFYSANAWDSSLYSIYYRMGNSLRCLELGAEDNPECGVKQGIVFNQYGSYSFGSGELIKGPDGQQLFHVVTVLDSSNFNRYIWLFEQKFNSDGSPQRQDGNPLSRFVIKGI